MDRSKKTNCQPKKAEGGGERGREGKSGGVEVDEGDCGVWNEDIGN